MHRIVFMGSPDFSVPVLRALIQHYTVVGVVTQPDRQAGRGRQLTQPPVKIASQDAGIPFIQPRRLSEPGALEQLQLWSPDLVVVASFGQILRTGVLDLPMYGCINVHASLLPRWRGAAPIQAAILNGDRHTGITIMKMDPGVDTGPTLSQEAVEISPDDTTATLSARLAAVGAALLIKTLPGYLKGELQPTQQDNSQATYAPMIKKEDGLLDFSLPAAKLERQVRAYNPWPGAYTTWNKQPLIIHRSHTADNSGGHPGKKLVHAGLPAFSTSIGILVVDEIQPAGKKSMSGKVFLQGARNWVNG